MPQRLARPSFFPLPLATGLLTAQIIGFFHVRHSNILTFEQMQQVKAAGFLPIPFGHAADKLSQWASALWGGVFFTLSLGAGLAIATWVIVNACKGVFGGLRLFTLAASAVWMALLVWINLDGFTLFGTLYAVLVPAVTAVFTIGRQGRPGVSLAWLLSPLIVLTALWYSQMDNLLFINIRDYLLLSNPAGRAINDFYYRYTMYPARSFKSFRQQTVRTCHLAKPDGGLDTVRLALIRNDIIPIADKTLSQMQVSLAGRQLRLSSPSGAGLVIPIRELATHPRRVIERFSAVTDRQARLRMLTFYGLLIGFPVLLYLTVFNLVLRLMHGLAGQRKAPPLTALFCLLLGCALLWPVFSGSREIRKLDNSQLASALGSSNWHLRLAALRRISDEGLEISKFTGYHFQVARAKIVERYWFAKALGQSRSTATLKELYRLLDDPHPNVVCQSLAALGQRNAKEAIAPILAKLTSTDHWYIQYYAYRALRRLGWNQGQSHRPA